MWDMYTQPDIPGAEWSRYVDSFTTPMLVRAPETLAFEPAGFRGFSIITEVPLGEEARPPYHGWTSFWEESTTPAPTRAPAAVIASTHRNGGDSMREPAELRSALGWRGTLPSAPDVHIGAVADGERVDLQSRRSPTGTLFSDGLLGSTYVVMRQDRVILTSGDIQSVDDVTPMIARWRELGTVMRPTDG